MKRSKYELQTERRHKIRHVRHGRYAPGYNAELPSQLAVFEDNCNNLRAAKEAGCYTVGFCDYYQSGLGWDVSEWSDELVPPDYERQKAMLEEYIANYEFKE